MTKKVWRKPEVKSIVAGSAESGANSKTSDLGKNMMS